MTHSKIIETLARALYEANHPVGSHWSAWDALNASEIGCYLDLVAPFVILQVSRFEGRLYPDARDACIDWEDGITTATHWMPAHFGKTDRPLASAEAQSAVAHSPSEKALEKKDE